jgi:hypothetical protein
MPVCGCLTREIRRPLLPMHLFVRLAVLLLLLCESIPVPERVGGLGVSFTRLSACTEERCGYGLEIVNEGGITSHSS